MWVAGEDVSGSSLQLRSKVGYLPESPAFYGWMTGRGFLCFTGELYVLRPKDAKARAEELLEQVNLTEAADRKVKGYSRGMHQHLGLAQALVHRLRSCSWTSPLRPSTPWGDGTCWRRWYR